MTEFPVHGPGLYGLGRVGGNGGTGGIFALLANEEVVEDARSLEGDENEGRNVTTRGGLHEATGAQDLPDFCEDEQEEDDKFWVGKGNNSLEYNIRN